MEKNAPQDRVTATPSMIQPRTLLEAIEFRARRSSDAIFVASLDGVALTYGDVMRRSEKLAVRLAASGVGSGDRVGLYLGNSPAWAVASVAVWRLGASVVACGSLLAPREAERALRLTSASSVVMAAPDRELDADIPILTIDEHGLVEGASEAPSAMVTAATVDPDAEAVVFFTSGTTGAPKGIPHRHADLIHWAGQVASAYAREAGFRATVAPEGLAPGVIFTPFGHIGGYLSLAFRVWAGRPVVLVPKFSPAAVAQLVSRYDLKALQLTPTMVHMLADYEEPLDLSGLDYVTSSTAPLTESLRERFETRFAVPVLQAYGMTEVGSIAQERIADVRAGRRPPRSVGRPSSGVEVRIIDEHGGDLPPGVDGDIVVRSASLGDDTIGSDVSQTTDGWFRTNDIGRLDDDGFLYVTGRVGDKLIVGGFNVYPSEVEDVLRRCEHVRDAVVVGLADERLGEIPVAAVVWNDIPQRDLVRAWIRAEVAHYKVPRSWVTIDQIPLTSRGKVDRKQARWIVEEALR